MDTGVRPVSVRIGPIDEVFGLLCRCRYYMKGFLLVGSVRFM